MALVNFAMKTWTENGYTLLLHESGVVFIYDGGDLYEFVRWEKAGDRIVPIVRLEFED